MIQGSAGGKRGDGNNSNPQIGPNPNIRATKKVEWSSAKAQVAVVVLSQSVHRAPLFESLSLAEQGQCLSHLCGLAANTKLSHGGCPITVC